LASDVYHKLQSNFNCQYDEKDAIGKRYRRQDAIGTPYCVTVDFDSLEDGTVTLRDRDTLLQKRVHIDQLLAEVADSVSMSNLLEKL
jgi:glycyl-tRNA synthetase